MSGKSNLNKGVLLLLGIVLIIGIAIYNQEIRCEYPRCNNRKMTDTGICLECRKRIGIVMTDGRPESSWDNSSHKSGSDDSSSYKNSSQSTEKSNSGQSTTSSYSKPKSTNNTKKYKTYGVEDYDDPDEYASDFAEDFAYDEFGEDSWEAYEYGYEEAYNYWMDEMGE